MQYILGSIALLILIFSLLSKDNDIKTLKPNDTILAIGDSLTYGYNAKPHQSYPSILSHLTGLKVINAGVNGDTSKDGLNSLSNYLQRDDIKLMILFFGGNDMLQKRSTKELKENLRVMIKMAKDRGIDTLLISVPNFGVFGFSTLELYNELADEEGVPLLSGIIAEILQDPKLKSDQIHPNALGYKIMAQKIFKKLQEEGWV
jgi:lysophospholipase L1-like esterase